MSRPYLWYRDDLVLDSLIYRGIDPRQHAMIPGFSHGFCERDISSYLAGRRARHAAYRRVLEKLLKSPGITQRTPDWYEARKTMITASDAAQALGRGKFGTQLEFFHRKLERVTVDYSSIPPLQWGVKYEPVATTIYEHLFGVTVHEFGLLQHPRFPFVGASPDGINDHGIMLEIKCPYRRNIDGTVPEQYAMQMQLQLDVCDLDECDYFECEFEEVDEYTFLGLQPNAYLSGGIVSRDGMHSYKYAFGAAAVPPQDIAGWAEEGRGVFFVLRKHNVVRVCRDVDAVSEMIRGLAEIRDRLEKYKRDPDALPPLKAKRARVPKQECLFVDSDDGRDVPKATQPDNDDDANMFIDSDGE
jgi:putative phage-type endonuclease